MSESIRFQPATPERFYMVPVALFGLSFLIIVAISSAAGWLLSFGWPQKSQAVAA